jgi:hypothetical protein
VGTLKEPAIAYWYTSDPGYKGLDEVNFSYVSGSALSFTSLSADQSGLLFVPSVITAGRDDNVRRANPFPNAATGGLRIFVDCRRCLTTASFTGLATQCFLPALKRVVDAPRC